MTTILGADQTKLAPRYMGYVAGCTRHMSWYRDMDFPTLVCGASGNTCSDVLE